jgi:hypothetical protein
MYRIGGILIAVALFVAFVPGVLITLPKNGSKWSVLLVHGVLFAIVTHYVMQYYHRHIVFREGFGNYGPTCPNGYVMGDDSVCRPTGQQTEPVNTGFQMEYEP